MIPETMDEEAICNFVESYGEEICRDTDLVCSTLLHQKKSSEKNTERVFPA
jgi:hypothetical protein